MRSWRRAHVPIFVQVAATIVAASAVVPAGVVEAQVSAQVPLESRTYEHIDALAAAGVTEFLIVGQRPYSRLEVARIIAAARARLAAADAVVPPGRDRIERILAILEATYAAELAALDGAGVRSAIRLDGAAIEATRLDSPARPIGDVGLGTIAATVNPLAENRGGRVYSDGMSAAGEVAGHAQAGRYLAFGAHLRAGPGRVADGGGAALQLRALNVTAGARNIVVEAGVQPVLFGQGITGGPLSSRNSPALPMVRIGNDVPAYLPWIFRHAGPARASLFVADLGAGQHYPHEKLAGWKVSFLPRPGLEIGASLLSQQGGTGAPPAAFHERVIDVLTLVDVLFLQDRDLLFSNKLAGVDVRVRLRGAELYVDAMLDDFDVRRLGSSLWEDGGFVTGITAAVPGGDGSVRLSAEYQHTGLRYYQHVQFKSGLTTAGSIVGLPLGPRGDALLARATWNPARRSRARITVALERRSDDRYTVVTDGPDDSGWDFVKTADHPEETRLRALVDYSVQQGSGALRLESEAGLELVGNHRFLESERRVNTVARVALVWGFR